MIKRAATLLAGVAILAACDKSAEVESETPEPLTTVAASGEAEDETEGAPERAANAITCNWPAQAGDTAQDLEALFGDDAHVQMVGGPEGMEIPGVVLWPDDEARRIEVLFADEARTQITNVRIFDGSQWRIGGLSAGSTLAQATAANGKPFELLGFEWDYGGLVTDLKGGTLADIDGCRVAMSFGPSAGTTLKGDVLGDVELMSDDSRLPRNGLTAWELGLVFPED